MVQVPSFLIHCPGQSSGEAPLKELGKDRCSWEKQHQQQMYLQLAPGLCLPLLWELSTPPNLCCLQMNEHDLTSLLEKQVKNSSTLCLLQLSEEKVTASLRRRNHLEHSRFILSMVLCVGVTPRQHKIFSGMITQLQCYKPKADVLSAFYSTFTLSRMR